MISSGQTLRSQHGTYLVQDERGRGGFGVAWRAVREDGEAVVLKELRLDRLENWKAMQLFEREARVMQNLQHPAIPSYIDFFGVDDAGGCHAVESRTDGSMLTMVLVQQYIAGANLEELRQRQKRYSAAEIELLLRTMLEVLVYLHALSPPVVHRDITPKNIIRADDGRFFLVDFGAIQDRIKVGGGLGSTNVGTFGFIPPEQALGRTKPASDLYALAMTVLVAATGVTPENLPLDEQTGKVMVAALELSLPSAVQQTLDAMLEPVIGQRIDSAATALALLESPKQLMVRQSTQYRAKLGIGRTVQIGRAENVDLRLVDPSVSRYHAAIVRRTATDYVVRDLSSARGTLVNGYPAMGARLKDGDILQFGAVVLQARFEFDTVVLTEHSPQQQLVVANPQQRLWVIGAVVTTILFVIGLLFLLLLLPI